ncbi:MAG TPA: acyl-CoA dehydrogenase family protein [Dehalococcoidia bacterium]|nr:acyl-CoA dehydrogenase family protein [Dehalococcoidia bacterium]
MTTTSRSSASIPVPIPDLTPRRMIESAAALRPFLRECQEDTEAAGRILPEVNDKFVAAGFYRTLQPHRFGGYEFDLPTFSKVMAEIARGCPSSAWVLTFTAGHTHVLSKYAEQAQIEAYGETGEFRCPTSGSPATARPVEGGYVVTGNWDYASGIDTATHFIGSGVIRNSPDDPPSGTVRCLLDRKDFEIVDNWDILGMRGSGSKQVVVKDLFVPSYRTNVGGFFGEWVEERNQPGHGLYQNCMYAGPSVNVLMAEIAAVAIGTGLCALDTYEEIMRSRTMRGTNASRVETPEYQRHYGQAQALLDTARNALYGCCQDYMDYCRLDVEEDDRFDQAKSQRITMVEQQCCFLAGQAVDLLFKSSGSTAAKAGQPMVRHFRDMATLLTHTTLQPERNWEGYARTYFGLSQPPNLPRSSR